VRDAEQGTATTLAGCGGCRRAAQVAADEAAQVAEQYVVQSGVILPIVVWAE